MPLQTWIYQLEEGQGAKVLRVLVAVLAFIAMAALYDVFCFEGFSSEEAMETAQLARNVAQGRGYTTDSIRPLALYLLETQAPAGQSSSVLGKPVPDLTNPPIYPLLSAGVMKILPFHFTATDPWRYQPEFWLDVFNQTLFFLTCLAVFAMGRSLFDNRVAWLAAILFAGTRLFWRFSLSGLSTLWLMLLFCGLAWALAAIEKSSRAEGNETAPMPWIPAILAGVLTGVIGLSRYSMLWVILPALVFLWLAMGPRRLKLCVTMLAAFLVVMGPWLARNLVLSGHSFGTGAYTVAQDTPAFPGTKMERSTDPTGGLTRVAPDAVLHKCMANARDICDSDLPMLGGNWISAFFLVGLFIPYRKPALRRMRWFVAGTLVTLIAIQAIARTHITADSPVINSENLLVVLSPLIFLFGAAFFFTLIDQFNLPPMDERAAVTLFAAFFCAPLILGLFSGRHFDMYSPYSPRHIQKMAHFMETNELITSDIPSGVAWYGQRACVWLPNDDDAEFYKVNALKPIHALFLTQATTDQRFLSAMEMEETSWGHFVLECWGKGEVPAGFPLRKAPRGFLPEQLFLSDKVRWKE